MISRKKNVWIFPKKLFSTFVFYLNAYCTEYTFQIYILLDIKNHYFLHFWWLFAKSSKAFIVPLNLLLFSLSSFSNNYSPVNNHLCDPLFDLLHFFKSSRMILNYFLLVDQKCFAHQSKQNLSFLHSEDNIFCNLFIVLNFEMIRQKVCLLIENLNQLSIWNIDFVLLLLLLILLIDNYSS